MKTYQEYLDIIRHREQEEAEEERKHRDIFRKKWEEEHPGFEYFDIDSRGVSKMTFDYSVEIMGMMMQDFLEEIKELR